MTKIDNFNDSLIPYCEILPAKFVGYLDEIHSETGFDRNYLFASMLSAFAGAMQKKFVVQANTYKQFPALYICLVGISGKGKTPPLKAIYKVLDDHNQKLCKEYQKQKKEIEKEIADAKIAKQDANLELPRYPKFVIGDATPEKLVSLLESNFGYQTLVMNELTGLLDNTNRYKSNSEPFYLTAYDQTNYNYDRKNGDSCNIQDATLNIAGTIQTALLSKFKENDRVTSGLLFRFLIVFPESEFLETDAHLIPKVGSKDPLAGWNESVLRVLNLQAVFDEYGEIQPRNVHLSNEASALLSDWVKDNKTAVNEKIANDENVNAESGFVSKSLYTVLRIALILETMRNIDNLDQSFTISRESALGAIKATDVFTNNGLLAFDRAQGKGESQSTEKTKVDLILSVMELGKEYTAKELMNLCGIPKTTFYNLLNTDYATHWIRRAKGSFWLNPD
jgi:hypothetical protein